MDPTNEVILSTLYALSQPTSIHFLWKKVNERKLIRRGAFQSRIAVLGEQGYLRLDTAGRNAMLVSLTPLGVDTVANLRPAASGKANAQPAGERAGIRPGQAALLLILAGSLVILLLCAGLFLARWQRGITTAQRQLTPLPETALSTPALALAATQAPQIAAVPSLTPPPTLTPAVVEKILLQTKGTNQWDDLNIGVQILAPIIDPSVSSADSGFNQAVEEFTRSTQERFRDVGPVPGTGGFLHIDYRVVSAEAWAPAENFPFFTESDPEMKLSSAVIDTGHPVLSVLFSSMSFAGGAHPGTTYHTINFDLNTGQQLTLSDLFQPGTPYLETIANYCIDQLPRRYGDRLFDDFRKGAEATNNNYRVWAVTRSGLLVIFSEYQLAPYAAGPQYILVPYETLSQIINPSGPIGQYAQ